MKNRHTEKLQPIATVNKGPAQSSGETGICPELQNAENGTVSTFDIIVKAITATSACIAIIMFVSMLFCNYTYEYNSASLPTYASYHILELPSDGINEDDVFHEPILYSFAEPVPESKAVDYDYFNNTVFIGDSRTKGLLMFTDLSPYDFSSVGLNIRLIRTKEFIRLADEDGNMQSYTLTDMLERELGNYKAIYIATGLNELGWEVDGFISAFSMLIDSIREITDVPIYIQLILPVTTHSSETTEYGITNEKCFIFNDRLMKLADEKSLFLLDPRDLFTLEDGTLDPAHSSDGIHLNRASCQILADYYRTHTVNIDTYDNTASSAKE